MRKRTSLIKNDFDEFIGIDWSGAKSPVKSYSISLAYCKRGQITPNYINEPLSRYDIAEWILKRASDGKLMLIGIDCNLGYSHYILRRQFGAGASVYDLWNEIDRLNMADNNFHAEKFWSDPSYRQYFWLSGNKPEWYSERNFQRITENECLSQGLGAPECPFKLIGPKQVGKGGLSGMRLVRFLSERLGDKICIWPFQEIQPSTKIVLTEIYPRLFWNRAGMKNTKVTDKNVLNNGLASYNSEPFISNSFSNHNSDALITSAALRFYIQSNLALKNNLFDIPEAISSIVKLEGWIFGVRTEKVHI